MAFIRPVANFDFHVFFFDADRTKVPRSGKEALTTLGRVSIGIAQDILFGSFQEVSGIGAEIEIEDYHEGGYNIAPRRFTKTGRYPSTVFKRGTTFNPDLWDWGYQVLYGTEAPIRKNGFILLTDRGGPVDVPGPVLLPLERMPVALWFFRNALPEKLDGPRLNAQANEIAIESLEITHEGLFRVGVSQIPGVGELLATMGL